MCPRLDCRKKLTFGKLLQHFKTDHNHQNIPTKMKKDVLEVKLLDVFFTEWPWLMVQPVNLEFDRQKFVFLSWRCNKSRMWYFYVKIIGSKRDATKYKSVISLTAQNGVSIFN